MLIRSSVSTRSLGKRLILDLRHVYAFIFKQKFKGQNLSVATQIFDKVYYLFKFDLKSGYHFTEVCLAFEWDFGSRKFSSNLSVTDRVYLPNFQGLCTIFSCRRLFGPTVVTYFAYNKGFIYWLRSYVYVYYCHFPRLLFVCNCFWYWFFSVLLAFLLFSRYLSMRCLGL